MSQPKVRVVGKLEYSEADGLRCWGSWLPSVEPMWMEEILPNAYEWPGIEKTQPSTLKDREAYRRTLHADPTYRQAAREFLERQRLEPQQIDSTSWWAYKDTVLEVKDIVSDADTARLLVKHFMLKRSRYYEKIRREVEALENLEKLQRVEREPIPEAVRLFVWQRDKGQCVKCGSRQRLEFDHIIPVAAGGSNTERNIQLLCESCNRTKGSTI
jgi:5-methylcytosine-specific restriction endonuclease McrA